MTTNRSGGRTFRPPAPFARQHETAMRQTQLTIGRNYLAKVSGKVVPVRLDRVETHFDHLGREKKRYHVTNQVTFRRTVFRSAGKFRAPASA